MSLRLSQLQLTWKDLLCGGQISEWVTAGKKSAHVNEPGIYRWLFSGDDGGRPSAYVGEAERLDIRLYKYLSGANRQIRHTNDLSDASISIQEKLRSVVKGMHRDPTLRIATLLSRKCDSGSVRLQRLQVDEEGWFFGAEVNDGLLNDRIGRVFLEHWAILSTEREGYTILNRNQSIQRKEWRKGREQAGKKAAFEGARLQARRKVN